MAMATAMAALRATEDVCHNIGGEDDGNIDNGIGDEATLTITLFVTKHIVANAIVHVVAIAIAFVSMQ